MDVIRNFFSGLSARYLALAAAMKNFAARHRMLTRTDIKAGVPFAFAFQLFWSVTVFGFLLEASPVARQMPAFGILLGLVASVLLFAATRILDALFQPVTKALGNGWLWMPLWLVVILGYLALVVGAPSAIIWLIAKVLPLSVHPVPFMQGLWVLVGDTLIGNMTGISLYVHQSPRQETGKDAGKTGS